MFDPDKRRSDVLRLADTWQRAQGKGDLLALMRARAHSWDLSKRQYGPDTWLSLAYAQSQLMPVYRAIVAARAHQKAPSPETYAAVMMWFHAVWPVAVDYPVNASSGWPKGVPHPIFDMFQTPDANDGRASSRRVA